MKNVRFLFLFVVCLFCSCWTCGREEPIYEAIWAENADFDEVLISPAMANDHLPDRVLEALEKV